MGFTDLYGYNPDMGDGNDKIKNSGASVRARPCMLCGQPHASGSPCSSNGADGAPNQTGYGDGELNDDGFPAAENECYDMSEILESISAPIGTIIGGKYQIIDYVGHGGMSTVYKARQQPIDKIVALKLLLSHLSRDEESVQRFFREAKAAGQISHPNVVNVFDFGITSEQRPYLVMDFVEGKNLEDILDEREKLPYQEAIPIFIEVCSGLAAAHECGIVHRDIKPSNIVIQNVNGGGQKVRIVDFGIAKMIDAESQHLTKTGEVFGSPLYMSPEQCEGRTLDGRSDIYGLGVVFYQTLCGKAPLVGQTALETMRKHMTELPESLQKNPEAGPIPLELENVIFKMMAKDRDKRYASTLEIKHDLQRIVDGDSRAFSSKMQYMGREISRKSKIIIAASVSSVLLAAAAVFAYPSICDELGKQKYSEGMQKFSQPSLQNEKDAQSLLESAVELSSQAGDVGLESKSLASLIRIYRKQNNPKLEAARRRRQELIRQELEKLEIGSLNIGEVLSNTEKEIRDVERKFLPKNGSANRSTDGETSDHVSVTDSLSNGEPGITDSRQSTKDSRNERKAKREIGSAYSDALIASGNLPEEERGYSLQRSMRKAAPAAGTAGAGGGGAAAAVAPRLAGAANAPIAPGRNEEGGESSLRSSAHAQSIKQQHVTYENLDRMEVLASLCAERGNYTKAKESAVHGIAIYQQLNCHESDELAGLYAVEALGSAKLQKWDETAASVQELERLSNLSASRQAELFSLKALLSLHLNNKNEAKAYFDKAIKADAASLVASKAIDMYKTWQK